MHVKYADPPYLGCCRLYSHDHPEGHRPFDGRCWDDLETHRLLIEWLQDESPDGWAMSATSVSLRQLLPLCPEDIRVGSWVKPFCIFKKGVRPAYAWEPILFRGGRNKNHPPPEKGGKQTTPKDYIAENITLKKGLTGAKPPAVCDWIMDLLGVRIGDTVEDVFAGTGIFAERAELLLAGEEEAS